MKRVHSDDRRRCEIRWFLRHSLTGEGSGRAYLALVAKHRGQAAADALAVEAREQWGRGNRGQVGDWR